MKLVCVPEGDMKSQAHNKSKRNNYAFHTSAHSIMKDVGMHILLSIYKLVIN
jgi:hypothetical protein